MMDINRLISTLEKYEGFRNRPYTCTAGKLTIGIGRNLTDKGITYSEAMVLLKNDLDECRWDLADMFSDFASYPDCVREVLINMRFQLGPGGFRTFKKFINAIKIWNFVLARTEMLDSKWARQDTPKRAHELAETLIGRTKCDVPTVINK